MQGRPEAYMCTLCLNIFVTKRTICNNYKVLQFGSMEKSYSVLLKHMLKVI